MISLIGKYNIVEWKIIHSDIESQGAVRDCETMNANKVAVTRVFWSGSKEDQRSVANALAWELDPEKGPLNENLSFAFDNCPPFFFETGFVDDELCVRAFVKDFRF